MMSEDQIATSDNDFDAELVLDHESGSPVVCGWSHWRLIRHGEIVVWGVGNIVVWLEEGYVFEMGPRVDSFDETTWEMRDVDGTPVGFCVGRVWHKIKREVSPDYYASEVGFGEFPLCKGIPDEDDEAEELLEADAE